MKRQLRILLWGFIAYILSYIVFFAFVNESRASWADTAYNVWTYGKFAMPLLVVVAMTGSAVFATGQELPDRRLWMAWGLIATPVVAWLSYDAWIWYAGMNDAPAGLIPDLNFILCAFIGAFLAVGVRFASWIAAWLAKRWRRR